MRLGARRSWYSLLAGKRRVSRHRLWWQVIVAVWSVEKGLSALAVPRKGGMKYQPRRRAGLGVQRAPTWGRTIFHIKAEKESKKLWSYDSVQGGIGHIDNAHWCVPGTGRETLHCMKVLILLTALSCSHYYSHFAYRNSPIEVQSLAKNRARMRILEQNNFALATLTNSKWESTTK